MARSLNIVAFDVPYPANYGGVIDVFYKLVWLRRAGVRVHLHCFASSRRPSKELEDLCEKVYYYPRRTGLISNLSFSPYNVRSRRSEELEKNLLSNNYPILFEVLHTCYLLNDSRFKGRKKIYRHSNIEHHYYQELARTERSLIKKIYLTVEAQRLRFFESILKHADVILAVNREDTAYFKKKFPNVHAVYLPSFHPNPELSIRPGHGDYLLFHGNLSISENYKAVEWLAENVFARVSFPVVVAGLNPPDFLKALLSRLPNVVLRESPGEDEITMLIRNAQIHLLYTAQPTGLKLKLLNVLFKGRFIVCNEKMIAGTGLLPGNSMFICHTPEEYVARINQTYHKEFTDALTAERLQLVRNFDNSANVRKLVDEIF